jgi:hypothetical protein
MFWGLCVMLEAVSWFNPSDLHQAIGYLAILQNVALLVVGMLMYRQSLLAENAPVPTST